MTLRRSRLEKCNLYLILDAQVCDHKRLWAVLVAGVNNGVDIVQLRDKLGAVRDAISFITRAKSYLKGRIPFIVNDRADLACMTRSAGVHVGQEDIPVKAARRIMGARPLVGKSCQTLAHVIEAQKEGADYLGFGSVFKTETKPGRTPMELDRLAQAVRAAKVPLFAIGGITRENIPLVRACGVRRIAVCRSILLARDPAAATRGLKKSLLV